MILRMKGSFIICFYFVRANLVDSFSSSLPGLFNATVSGEINPKARDQEMIPRSNEVDDYLAESMLPSKDQTSLDTQFPQSRSDLQPIRVGIDQRSAPDDQSNPIEPSGSNTLALDLDDIPSLPFLPNIGGEMNYGGPNIFQQFQQLWQHPFDVEKQPEPDCKPRTIPWSVDKPVKTFAMCCGKTPSTSGPGSGNRLRGQWRRAHCYIWSPDERCTPDTIHCCFCKNERRIGFECVKYYTDQGVPADPSLNPPRIKREAILMTRRQDAITTNDPFSAVDQNEPMIASAGILPSPPATVEEDDTPYIAMELGETAEDKPKKGRPRGERAEWTCPPEFERSQGGTPRNRQRPQADVDNMEPPEYEPHQRSDEEDSDYSDLEVPDDLYDGFYWTPR